MKKIVLFMGFALVLVGCVQENPELVDQKYAEKNNYVKEYCIEHYSGDVWYSYMDDEGDYGWRNIADDEVMIPAQYMHIHMKCFNNSTEEWFVAVLWADESDKGSQGMWYLKPNGEKIIQTYIFDASPDFFEEGFARYVDEGKVGFLNEDLEIVIPAQFEGAWHFEDGEAKVCDGCEWVFVDDMGRSTLEGGIWGVVDKNGVVSWDE